MFLLCLTAYFTAAPLLEGCCTAGVSLTAAAGLPPGCYKICEVNFEVAQWSIVYYIQEKRIRKLGIFAEDFRGFMVCWHLENGFIGVEYGGDIRK